MKYRPEKIKKLVVKESDANSAKLSEFGKMGAEVRNEARMEEQRKSAEREAGWQVINAARIKQQRAENRKRDAQIQKELDEQVVMSPDGDMVHPHDLNP